MTDSRKRDFCERAFNLAANVFRLYPKLAAASAGHALIARQLLSATASMGSQLEEGQAASSRRDMAAKYSIALREAREAMLTTAVRKLRLAPAAVIVRAFLVAFVLLTFDFLLLT